MEELILFLSQEIKIGLDIYLNLKEQTTVIKVEAEKALNQIEEKKYDSILKVKK